MASRDERINFKLTTEKKEELDYFANSYGITRSALCALIIGQWLHQQNNVVNPMVSEMTNILKQQLNQSYETISLEKMQKIKEIMEEE